jgi:hypothetical protein
MRAPTLRRRAAVAAAAALLLAAGVALAAPRPGLATRSRAPAGCVCHLVCDCKNLLLEGVHLGHRTLRAALHAVLDRAHEVADSAREASAGGSPRRTAP